MWLRQPDLVVLDEATARVDPSTEARIEAAVDRLMRGRTTLIIAHRLSTLRRVDEIVVFDHGEMVEHGDRVELTADDDSRYARLLALALEPDDGDGDREQADHERDLIGAEVLEPGSPEPGEMDADIADRGVMDGVGPMPPDPLVGRAVS